MFLSEIWARGSLERCAHPGVGLEPVQGGFQPAERARLSGYARSRQAVVVRFRLTGDLIPPPGRPELQYQPHSALVNCNAGERVLLRFANLGFREAAMTLAGHPSESGRTRCNPDEGARWHRYQLRNRHAFDGRRRKLRCHLHRPGLSRDLAPTTLMCSTTAATPRMMICRHAGSAHRSACLPCRNCPCSRPQQTRYGI